MMVFMVSNSKASKLGAAVTRSVEDDHGWMTFKNISIKVSSCCHKSTEDEAEICKRVETYDRAIDSDNSTCLINMPHNFQQKNPSTLKNSPRSPPLFNQNLLLTLCILVGTGLLTCQMFPCKPRFIHQNAR